MDNVRGIIKGATHFRYDPTGGVGPCTGRTSALMTASNGP